MVKTTWTDHIQNGHLSMSNVPAFWSIRYRYPYPDLQMIHERYAFRYVMRKPWRKP